MINNFTTDKITVSIDLVIPNPYNPNFMDKSMFEKAKKSVEELGLLGSILVREYAGHYQILDGEHRWKVAKELGWTEIPVEVIKGDVTDDMAKFLTIHINNLHGKDDVFKRAEILAALNEGQLQLLPFTAEEIDNEKKFVQFDFSQYDVQADAKERKFDRVIVLQMNKEEAQAWDYAKRKMIERDWIDKDNAKKRQDVQFVMRMLKMFFGVADGALEGQEEFTIEA